MFLIFSIKFFVKISRKDKFIKRSYVTDLLLFSLQLLIILEESIFCYIWKAYKPTELNINLLHHEF